mmetsp:Transcript_105313/g.339694  ORF Transcript_105313/g.339694 Transcript_105313/m.339694 type:complete len:241 (+) Transcript_105313:633-1355(+)
MGPEEWSLKKSASKMRLFGTSSVVLRSFSFSIDMCGYRKCSRIGSVSLRRSSSPEEFAEAQRTTVSKISSSCMFQESCLASSTTASLDKRRKSSDSRMWSSVTISSMHLSTSLARPYCTPTSSILQACSLLVLFWRNCTLNCTSGATSKRTLTSRIVSTFSTVISAVPQYISFSITSKAAGSTSLMRTSRDDPSAKPPQSMRSRGRDQAETMFRCATNLRSSPSSPCCTTKVTSARRSSP